MLEQLEKKNERSILGDIVVSGGGWKRSVAVLPEDLSVWASDGDFADEKKPLIIDPILDTPEARERGGFALVPSSVSRIGLQEMLYIMGIPADHKKYAAFYLESSCPESERFYSQMRIVSSMALYEYYTVICDSDCELWPKQSCNVGEALWWFICQENSRYGPDFNNEADQELGFGLVVERNVKVDMFGIKADSGIFRIWSRPVHPKVKKIEG